MPWPARRPPSRASAAPSTPILGRPISCTQLGQADEVVLRYFILVVALLLDPAAVLLLLAAASTRR
jgi:hypothetical protein